MRLRWKMEPKLQGLSAVGAGPRASEYTDGENDYAMVYPKGGNWMGELQGWYWVSSIDADNFVNTCNQLVATEAEAKKAAAAHVKAYLKGVT